MWNYTGCCGYAPAYPVWCWPQHEHQSLWAEKELSASTPAPNAQATVGGVGSAFLSLDYLKDRGAESSSVRVTITDASGTGEWHITTIPDGFQAKSEFAAAVPGATVKLDVTGCTAQLKWYERVL